MDTKTKITQCDMVLAHIRKYGGITQGEALDLYGCARLASRISELRKAGYNIKTISIKRQGRFGMVRYGRYVEVVE